MGIKENILLKNHYDSNQSRALALMTGLISQISTIIEREKIALGVPLESRIKSWSSIEEKIDRKSIDISKIDELDDLIGIRIITLFEKDAEKIESIFFSNFVIIETENTKLRLSESQFGYQSRHLIAKISDDWEKLPTFRGMSDLKFEVQIRTLSQHIWAAASHKLQYKRESSIPEELRRSIFRVSALLETVDLELARLQKEREDYDSETRKVIDLPNILSLENVRAVMSEIWPSENADDFENFEEIFDEVSTLGIKNSKEFADILRKNRDSTLAEDKKTSLSSDASEGRELERKNRGVFFTLTGLTRTALINEFGDVYENIISRTRDENLIELEDLYFDQ